MSDARDGIRAGAKKAQGWLRENRRLERGLHSLTQLKGPTTRFSHELIVPMNSTYSPWYDEAEFRHVYEAIKDHTLVDQYKCYGLWQQMGQLRHVDGAVLEVGVWRGGTGVLLARRCRQLGFDADIFLADTFEGVVKAGEDDPWYRGGEHADTSEVLVEGLASRLGVDVHLLKGIFPEDTGEAIQDHKLRLAHIDVDVYQSAKDVLLWVWPRLSVGGAVVWDDFGSFECEGVAQLGRELFDVDSERFRLVHNLNGQLLMVKLSDGPLGLGRLPDAVDDQ